MQQNSESLDGLPPDREMSVTMELVFLFCVAAIGLLGARAWRRGQSLPALLQEAALLVAIAGFSGAQVFLAGGWGLVVGLVFILPALAVSLNRTGNLLLERHGARARLPGYLGGSAVEGLLHEHDLDDYRERRSNVFKGLRRVAVAPGVAIALMGVLMPSATVVGIGLGCAALGAAVVARLRRTTRTPGRLHSPRAEDDPATVVAGRETI